MKKRRSWQPSPMLVLVANAGGIEAARGLVKHFRGKLLYVPGHNTVVPDNHELILAIGRPATVALQDAYGGTYVSVPVGRDLRLDMAADAASAAAAAGDSERYAIARALDVSYATAKRFLKKLKSGARAGADTAAPPPRKGDPRQIDIEDLLR